MGETYEYRTIRIRRGAWRELRRGVTRDVAARSQVREFTHYALFAGLIGLATDEGVLMRAWSDERALAEDAGRSASILPALLESTMERLVPSVRPLDATPPEASGVYAHRWFWLQPQDWPEFQQLSEDGVWPYFESDGCRIVGLWRSAEPGPLAKALLITRYPSVAHWERTRLQASEAPAGVDERLYRAAQDAGRRRAELTERSIVRLTALLPPN